MSAASELQIDLLNLRPQTLFGLLLGDDADAPTDANAAVPLVDEAASIRTDRLMPRVRLAAMSSSGDAEEKQCQPAMHCASAAPVHGRSARCFLEID